MNRVLTLSKDAEISHLEWAMEEKVSKEIMLVWFNPAMLPHKALTAAKVNTKGLKDS